MANPALWGFGLASVALIGAGLWLKAGGGAAPPVAVEPVAVEPVAVVPVEGPAGDAPEMAPETEPQTGAQTGPQTGPQSGPQSGPGADRAPPAAKPPPPQPPPPADDRTEAAPRAPRPVEGGFLPVPASGGAPVWQRIEAPGIDAARIDEALAAIGRDPAPLAHFGALALSRARQGSRFWVMDAGDPQRAEFLALNRCARTEADCVIVARLVPSGWDAAAGATLGASQAAVWADFAGAADDGLHRAFAWSPEGAAGQAAMADADMAADLATRRCGDHPALRRTADLPPQPCRVIALRDPAPVAAVPLARRAVYLGAAAWRHDPTEAQDDEARARTAQAIAAFGGRPFFGALAQARGGVAVELAAGFATLPAAAAAALRQCQARGAPCEIVARIVPDDFDGNPDSLNGAQAALLAHLQRDPAGQHRAEGWVAVMAWSVDGALGGARARSEAEARTQALAECRAGRAALTLRDPQVPDCLAETVPPRP